MEKGFYTFEEKMELRKISSEELEARLKKSMEENAKLTDWLPVPDTYIDL